MLHSHSDVGRIAHMTSTADDYLAQCVCASLDGASMPVWRDGGTPEFEDIFIRRVLFHGIALMLAEQSDLAAWPAAVVERIKEQARLQTFWEASHCTVVAGLVEALHANEIRSAFMKGTAVAYSLYRNPAARRRGDTDILIPAQSISAVRSVFTECGFKLVEKHGALQESWQAAGRDGFVHEVDLHWRISSSPAIARALETTAPTDGWVRLPRLSAHAMCLTPAHNLIMACINRAAHATFGYFVEDAKLRESDRLIWATDIRLLCQAMCPADWDALVDMARASDIADIVLSGLDFAQRAVEAPVPEPVPASLKDGVGRQSIHHYLTTASQKQRLAMDWSATRTLADRLDLIRRHAFPDKAMLLVRYAHLSHWPIPVLYLRRLVSGAVRLLRA